MKLIQVVQTSLVLSTMIGLSQVYGQSNYNNVDVQEERSGLESWVIDPWVEYIYPVVSDNSLSGAVTFVDTVKPNTF